MKVTFKDTQRTRAAQFFSKQTGGVFSGKPRDFVLLDSRNNLFAPIYDKAIHYFHTNRIAWWGDVPTQPTPHTLSSQIACINHLFAIREDENAVLRIVQKIAPGFTGVFRIESDIEDTRAFIAFEVISGGQLLNEREHIRGSKCTSLDALIYAQHENGKKYLLPIEWKYTESYGNEPCENPERKGRYTKLIDDSKQLVNISHEIYYFEPFYQLMRQTLWAEQVIRHKSTEPVKADDFIHVLVIPEENEDLLNKKYPCSGKDLKTTWKQCLREPDKCRVISPKDLLANIDHTELKNYLEKRYW